MHNIGLAFGVIYCNNDYGTSKECEWTTFNVSTVEATASTALPTRGNEVNPLHTVIMLVTCRLEDPRTDAWFS